MDLKKYKCIITGVTALRQHRRPMPGDKEVKSIGARIPTKEEEKVLFENHRYWDKAKGYFQPSMQIKKAIVLASHREKIPGQKQSKFSKLVGAGGIMIEPDRIYHKNQKDVKCVGHWTVNTSGFNKSQVWCVKPEIHNWELEFEITNFMPEIITDEYLKKFIEWAGLFCGIGADRPERGKLFGRFELKSFKVLK